jgi:hypothetical protein
MRRGLSNLIAGGRAMMAYFMQEKLERMLSHNWLRWADGYAVDCDRDDGIFIPMAIYRLNNQCEWVWIDPMKLRPANYDRIFNAIQPIQYEG